MVNVVFILSWNSMWYPKNQGSRIWLYMVHTDLKPFFSSTFQGQITVKLSLCIEVHVPTYCISTGPSALLTPWHRKIPFAWDDSRDQLSGVVHYCYLTYLRNHIFQGYSIGITCTALQFQSPHEVKTVSRDVSRTKLCLRWAFCAQDNVASMKFYLFKDLSMRFKDCWEKLKDFSRTWTNFSIFKDFSRGWYFFKDYSRPVQTML